ncbi:MAG TPA: TetR family transcriptional regulator [Streptosporangiaceae bacterium]
MTYAPATPGPAPMRRRDQQKEQTRLDLALAAFELAQAEGLAQVRVPQIAEAVGVSTRTFNNYFPSKEAAIVWPATLRGDRMARDLAGRPAGEPLADALVEVLGGLYGPAAQEGLPRDWVDGFRAMVATEPALHGEFLKAQASAEQKLATAIAGRTGAAGRDLEPLLLAGVVLAAERAAVMYWSRQAEPSTSLAELIRSAVATAVRGVADPRATLT